MSNRKINFISLKSAVVLSEQECVCLCIYMLAGQMWTCPGCNIDPAEMHTPHFTSCRPSTHKHTLIHNKHTHTHTHTWPGRLIRGHTTTGSGRLEAGIGVALQGGITRYYYKYNRPELLFSIILHSCFFFLHFSSLLHLLCDGNPSVFTFTTHFHPPLRLWFIQEQKEKKLFRQTDKKSNMFARALLRQRNVLFHVFRDIFAYFLT